MVFWSIMFMGAMSAPSISRTLSMGMTSECPKVTSSRTNSSSNSGFLLAPLWFPYSMASSRSCFLRLFAKSSSGNFTPSERMDLNRGHRGWSLNRGSRVWGPLNSEPYLSGEVPSFFIASPSVGDCRRMLQLCFAASSVNSKVNLDGDGPGVSRASMVFILSRKSEGQSADRFLVEVTVSL